MSQFSTNEAVSLEKHVELNPNLTKTKPEHIEYVYEVDRCVKWILENDFKKACLQFPDYLLPDSVEVIQRIEEKVRRKVYILGDTAYESCCIDFTTAKHISADGIIHFGPSCFSKTENIIPHLKIYEKYDLNVEDICENILSTFNNLTEQIIVILETCYIHKIDEIRNKLPSHVFQVFNVDEIIDISGKNIIFIGQNDRKLMNINLTMNPNIIRYLDPKISNSVQKYEQDSKVLKRRYFLTEKIKDSATIGIVISTLAVKNYLKIIERLKTLIKVHEKKYYIISVGKPNVAKLANFPEIDVFVIVGCSMNDIYENRDFYKPILTPFDIEFALNSKLPSTIKFSYDYNQILQQNPEIEDTIREDQSDVSLLTGNIRYQGNNNQETIAEDATKIVTDVAVRTDGKLQVNQNFGAGFLANRSWKGLEQDLGKNEVKLAVKGRKGIAQGYENENESQE